MRRAKYSAKKVFLPKVQLIGFDTNEAKPGHWVVWHDREQQFIGRVLGRIERTPNDGLQNCEGWLAVMRLGDALSHAYIAWVSPLDVVRCLKEPPRALLEWITSPDWVKRAADIPRYIAMVHYGTTSEHYIEARTDPGKPYNADPDYPAQFVLI